MRDGESWTSDWKPLNEDSEQRDFAIDGVPHRIVIEESGRIWKWRIQRVRNDGQWERVTSGWFRNHEDRDRTEVRRRASESKSNYEQHVAFEKESAITVPMMVRHLKVIEEGILWARKTGRTEPADVASLVSTALIDRGYSYKEEATLREEVRKDHSAEEIGEVRGRQRAEITANGGLVIDQPGIYLEIPKANLDAFISSIAKIIADQVIAELAARQHSKI